MATKILVDAGHGGYDNGATYKERKEKDDALRLALAVGKTLANKGLDVLYTRTGDVYQNPNEKAYMANSSGVDYFVSIHRNTGPAPNTYSGVEVLVYNKGDIKEKIADNMMEGLEQKGFHNLGVTTSTNVAVLKRTKMPSFLIEVGFINSDYDNQLFDEKITDIANAIAQGFYVALPIERKVPFYYHVQVGLFRSKQNAINLQAELQQGGFGADIVRMGDYYAVITGNFNSMEQAQELEQELKDKGYETQIIAL